MSASNNRSCALSADTLQRLLDDAKIPGELEPWDKRGRPLYDRPVSLGGKVVGHTGEGDRGLLWPTVRGSQVNYGTPSVEADRLVAAAVNSLPALLEVVRAASVIANDFPPAYPEGEYAAPHAHLVAALGALKGNKGS